MGDEEWEAMKRVVVRRERAESQGQSARAENKGNKPTKERRKEGQKEGRQEGDKEHTAPWHQEHATAT